MGDSNQRDPRNASYRATASFRISYEWVVIECCRLSICAGAGLLVHP